MLLLSVFVASASLTGRWWHLIGELCFVLLLIFQCWDQTQICLHARQALSPSELYPQVPLWRPWRAHDVELFLCLCVGQKLPFTKYVLKCVPLSWSGLLYSYHWILRALYIISISVFIRFIFPSLRLMYLFPFKEQWFLFLMESD